MGLQISSWAFWSPRTNDPFAWCEHLGEEECRVAPRDVPSDLIPASHRRRMSVLSRMAVQVALQASSEPHPDFLVFCSQHGEFVRTRRLLDDIANGIELSPAEFSQSVHNTSAGLYAIIADTRAAASCIASGASTFASAWLEAEAILDEHPDSRVLLVDHDDMLPPEYASFTDRAQHAYAVALLLSRAPDAGVRLDLAQPDDEFGHPMGPHFLAWWLSTEPVLAITAESQSFTWTRNVES